MSVVAIAIDGWIIGTMIAPEAGEGAGAVQDGGLLQLHRDGGQPGQVDDHREADALPHHHHEHAPQREVRVGRASRAASS